MTTGARSVGPEWSLGTAVPLNNTSVGCDIGHHQQRNRTGMATPPADGRSPHDSRDHGRRVTARGTATAEPGRTRPARKVGVSVALESRLPGDRPRAGFLKLLGERLTQLSYQLVGGQAVAGRSWSGGPRDAGPPKPPRLAIVPWGGRTGRGSSPWSRQPRSR